jgi:hypothetical protein
MPWHAPHAAAAPEGSVQAGVTAGGAGRFAPWHAVFVHDVPFQTGTRSALRRPSGEVDVHNAVEVSGREHGRRYDMAVRARDGRRDRGVLVGRVSEGGRPGARSPTRGRHHRAAAVAKLNATVEVQGPPDRAVPVAFASAWHPVHGPEK